jgi:hypothetical protein
VVAVFRELAQIALDRYAAGALRDAAIRYQALLLDINDWRTFLLTYPPQPVRGRPKGSGYFRDEAEFCDVMRTVIGPLIHTGKRPTRENVARFLRRGGTFQTENLDTAVQTLKRYHRRYGYTWHDIVAMISSGY